MIQMSETKKAEYEEKTKDRIIKYLEAQGYEAAGPVLEMYFDMDPDAVEPSKLRTQVWIPVVKK